MKTLLLLLLTLPLLTGCASFGMHKVIRELAKDPATVRLRVPTPYGIVELDRTNPAEGMPHAVSSGGTRVGDEGDTIMVPVRLKVQ